MTKLPIIQFQSCTTPKIYREPFPNHSQTIPIKILATNFAVPAYFDKNDQLSSNSTPMVPKGAVLLAKIQVLLDKSEK